MYELKRTNPDYVVYIPKGPSAGKRDGTNHVVTVLPGLKERSFIAFWLQDSAEQAPDSHYVCSRSEDGGKTWTDPITIAGQNFDPKTGRDRCSFGTAFRNAKGRIYLMLNHYSGYADPHENGFLDMTYSDDDGLTFATPVQVFFQKFSEYDNDDPNVPPTMIAYQPPQKISTGKYVGGITRYASLTKFPRRPHWTDEESVCSMYVIENADDNPAPQDLKFTWTTCLKAPSRNNPAWCVAQEPSIVELPDGRLFCAFRTNSGSPWYAISTDGGYTWGESEVSAPSARIQARRGMRFQPTAATRGANPKCSAMATASPKCSIRCRPARSTATAAAISTCSSTTTTAISVHGGRRTRNITAVLSI